MLFTHIIYTGMWICARVKWKLSSSTSDFRAILEIRHYDNKLFRKISLKCLCMTAVGETERQHSSKKRKERTFSTEQGVKTKK